MNGFTNKLLAAVAFISLSITLIGCGLLTTAGFSSSTKALSEAFSNDLDSPFTAEQLTQAAIATRDYTVADNNLVILAQTIAGMNEAAKDDPAYATAIQQGAQSPDGSLLSGEAQAANDALAQSYLSTGTEEFVLTPDAISHLDDVYNVITMGKAFLFGAFIVACISIISLGFRVNPRRVSCVLLGSAIMVVALFLLMAAWVCIDFNGFFAAFHSLFFSAGTWTFSWDSLLICMYPPNFWIGMGALWLATTLAACMVCVIAGVKIRNCRVR